MSTPSKSEWMGCVCDGPKTAAAIRSWFGVMVPEAWGAPLKADILTRIEDDRELKMRALFRSPDGQLREAVRTLGGRNYTIRVRPASPGILKDFREKAEAAQ